MAVTMVKEEITSSTLYENGWISPIDLEQPGLRADQGTEFAHDGLRREECPEPRGEPEIPLNPLTLAITMGAPFVARGFAGEQDHLNELIKEAILSREQLWWISSNLVSALTRSIPILYRERVVKLEKPLTDRYEALKMADLWGEKIPIGVIYRNEEAECREEKKSFGNR